MIANIVTLRRRNLSGVGETFFGEFFFWVEGMVNDQGLSWLNFDQGWVVLDNERFKPRFFFTGTLLLIIQRNVGLQVKKVERREFITNFFKKQGPFRFVFYRNYVQNPNFVHDGGARNSLPKT